MGVMFELRPGQNYGEERHLTEGTACAKVLRKKRFFFLKLLDCIERKKGLLGQRTEMEVAEAGKWL